jgi:hypothetical protein
MLRGELHDTILDWEDQLPTGELNQSELNCKRADLCLCLGTSLQIMPCGNFPLLTKKNNGKIVVINLQETRINKHADLIINYKLDDVFRYLFEFLKIETNLHVENTSTIKIKSDYTQNDKQKMLINVSNVRCLFEPVVPSIVIMISGKRKSGKDYVCKKLMQLFSNTFNVQVLTIAASMKQEYAKANNLDYYRLLGSSSYKEVYRLDMIRFDKRLVSSGLDR